MASSETGSSETSASERDSSETGSSETGSSEIGSSETGSSVTGSSERGFLEKTWTFSTTVVGSWETGSSETDSTTIGSLESFRIENVQCIVVFSFNSGNKIGILKDKLRTIGSSSITRTSSITVVGSSGIISSTTRVISLLTFSFEIGSSAKTFVSSESETTESETSESELWTTESEIMSFLRYVITSLLLFLKSTLTGTWVLFNFFSPISFITGSSVITICLIRFSFSSDI